MPAAPPHSLPTVFVGQGCRMGKDWNHTSKLEAAASLDLPLPSFSTNLRDTFILLKLVMLF